MICKKNLPLWIEASCSISSYYWILGLLAFMWNFSFDKYVEGEIQNHIHNEKPSTQIKMIHLLAGYASNI